MKKVVMREIIIADNQDITRLGLRKAISLINETGSIVEVANKKDLINSLSTYTHALVIIDYTLFDIRSGNELMILNDRFSEVSWILFSDELSDDLLKMIVFNSESFSVVTKSSNLKEINTAITTALRWERFICSRISSQLSTNKSIQKKDYNLLTATEEEILKEIAQGKTTKEIAHQRNLSFHTITTHRKNIFRKLEVNNVHEATKYAMRAGIIDIAEYYI